jgi:hypothetical protein
MTLQFFTHARSQLTGKERFYISQFDSDTYQIIDAIENREICVVSNYDEREDAKARAENIAKLLNDDNEKTLG